MVNSEDKTGGYFWGTGRRKTAKARVRLRPGHGEVHINGRLIDVFFRKEVDRTTVTSPLRFTKLTTAFDVFANVDGGGSMGQAEAVRMGIARALLHVDQELRKPLRNAGFLTRDPRIKEAKKYGRKKARRGFQFVKR